METFSALLALCEGNHRSPVDSIHKVQWGGTSMFSMICAWTNGSANNRDAGDFRRRGAHCHCNEFLLGQYVPCISTLVYSCHNTEPLPAIENDPSSFAEDWLAAFKAQEHTDVIFVLASGTEMRAHKIVICAASSFLASIINSDNHPEVKPLILLFSSLSMAYDAVE